jgi:hypothetical protein
VFVKNFELLLGAKSPIIYIRTLEENRVDTIISNILLNSKKYYEVFEWDYIEGFQNKRNKDTVKQSNPMQALNYIARFSSDQPSAFVLKDFQKFITDIGISRKLRNIIRDQKRFRNQNESILIIIAPEVILPNDLVDIVSIIEFPLPTYNEIRAEILRLLWFIDDVIIEDLDFIEILVRACQGLTMDRIRAIFSKAVFYNKSINASTLRLVLNEKKRNYQADRNFRVSRYR